MTTQAFTIRHAGEKDLQAILEIYNDAILHTTAVYDYKPHTPEMRQAWFAERRRDGFPVLVAEKEGAITGFGTYGLFRRWGAYKYSVEGSVYVHQDHRRHGIAKDLMKTLIGMAEQNGVHAFVGGIDSENTGSLRLCEELGFEKVAHFREVGYKFGRWLDLVFMQLVLKTPLKPTED